MDMDDHSARGNLNILLAAISLARMYPTDENRAAFSAILAACVLDILVRETERETENE
jgi:hypothetical protein